MIHWWIIKSRMFIWSVVYVKNLIVFLFCKTDFTSSILNKQHTQKVNKLLKHVTAKLSYRILQFYLNLQPTLQMMYWCSLIENVIWLAMYIFQILLCERTFVVVAFIQYIQRKQALWKYCCIKKHVSYQYMAFRCQGKKWH